MLALGPMTTSTLSPPPPTGAGTDNFWKIHTELGEHEVVGILLALAALNNKEIAAFDATASQLRTGCMGFIGPPLLPPTTPPAPLCNLRTHHHRQVRC